MTTKNKITNMIKKGISFINLKNLDVFWLSFWENFTKYRPRLIWYKVNNITKKNLAISQPYKPKAWDIYKPEAQTSNAEGCPI